MGILGFQTRGSTLRTHGTVWIVDLTQLQLLQEMQKLRAEVGPCSSALIWGSARAKILQAMQQIDDEGRRCGVWQQRDVAKEHGAIAG